MKRFAWLALLLCIVLTASFAVAEDAAYTPGEKAQALVLDALKSGKMLCGDISLSTDLDADMLAPDAETAQIIDLAQQVIGMVHLNGGVGVLDDGVRLTVGASLQNGQNSAGIDGALNVTTEGLSIESNVISGEKLVISWAELYAALAEELGLPEDLSAIDWNALAENFMVQAGAVAEQAGTWIEPYVIIFATHMQNWSVDVQQNVPAENGYPAVDQQVTVTLTAADMADLLSDIAAQLAQDQQLVALVESIGTMIGATNVSVDVSELVDALNEVAGEYAATDMVETVILGYSDTDVFLAVQVDLDSQPVAVCNLLINALDENNASVSLDVYGAEDGIVKDQFSLAMQVAGDGDATNINLYMLLAMDGEVIMNVNADGTTQRDLTGAGLPAINSTVNVALTEVDDSIGTVQIMENVEGMDCLTMGGGEASNREGALEIYINDQQIFAVPFSGSWILELGENGLTGEAEGTISLSELGLNALSCKATVNAMDYDPASTDALVPFNLLTATQEDFDALGQRVQMGAAVKMIEMLGVLPENILNFIMSNMSM